MEQIEEAKLELIKLNLEENISFTQMRIIFEDLLYYEESDRVYINKDPKHDIVLKTIYELRKRNVPDAIILVSMGILKREFEHSLERKEI